MSEANGTVSSANKRGGDRRSAAARAANPIPTVESSVESTPAVVGTAALVGDFSIDSNAPINAETAQDRTLRITMRQAKRMLGISENTIRKLFKVGDDGTSVLPTSTFEYKALGTIIPVTTVGAVMDYQAALAARGVRTATQADPNRPRTYMVELTAAQSVAINAIGADTFDGDLSILRGVQVMLPGAYRAAHKREDGTDSVQSTPGGTDDVQDETEAGVLEGANAE